ncbi:mediator of RNA polymerase II transcription subunit 16 [Caerostris darwini]|uniref:Mediator of RNA polymerase II transcription subunit 16 n=1 Tax=Caerostris darwini TaxID=1538125 RepID=A0AAV4TPZ3_9ARAC|nr:mediator of RNA polymerase II transcription subunit 16 [Caerostris darwini]
MDHIYSVLRRITSNASSNTDWITEGRPVISVSSRNTIAFTSTTDLHDGTAKISRIHVYVADLNMPWEAYEVLSHNEDISCLEWDINATKLLIADAVGCIQVWAMKDFLLNEWVQITSTTFEDYILAAAWFHNGKKIALNMEKKDNALYLEKYSFIRFGPSVKQFGSKPSEGLIAITMTGMVFVIVLQSDGNIITGTAPLGEFRSKIKVIDLCYAKSGDFLVVTSDGLVQSSVHCFRVGLKVNQEECFINCEPFSSFFLNCHATSFPIEKPAYTKVTHLKFILREAADAVVITASGPNGSTVELWELREKPVTFNKFFSNVSLERQPKTVVWQHHISSTSPSSVVAMATPRLSIYDANPPPSYILVAYKDNSIKCFYRESLQLACNISVNTGSHRRDEHTMYSHQQGMKPYFHSAAISDMQLSWTGCTLVAIDSLSQVFLYRLCPVTDIGGPMTTSYALTVLEYCLVTGTDWWDVVLSLRPGWIESICEKFTESFNRQPPAAQQGWISRYLSIKGSLYRCLSNGLAKAGDCHAMIMLNAIASAMKSLLRPRDLSSQDKGPAENLAAILSGKGTESSLYHTEKMDTVLLKIESKEFTVEPPILQSLQHLTQWVADCALYLLATLPYQTPHHNRYPGGGLVFDPKALNTLRELLVIIRIWSLLNESCLPMFTKMADNIDVLSLLYKLLTKTLLNHGSELDDTLLDECSLLPNQVLVPIIELGTQAFGVASPALFMNSLPLQFEYLCQPEFLKYNSKAHNIEGTIPQNHKTDIVRHVSLGNNPTNVRQCTRCYSSSMLKAGARSAATRAWDQRWLKCCPCGGQWKFIPSLES